MYIINTSRKFLAILALLMLTCCTKQAHQIPNVAFSTMFYLNDKAFNSNPCILKSDFSGKRAGIYGVVAYRVSTTEFYVFDLMCPNEKSMTCLVEVEDGVSVRCPCCQSRFLIATGDGAVVEGPAGWPLKAYSNSTSGNYLNIWN
jgi:nitrite reductase/ring-hydroxylating ferredoxin subunit